MIDECALHITGIDSYRIEKTYISKKNNVFLAFGVVNGVERKFIVKKFLSNVIKEKEVRMLGMLQQKGVPVPCILGEDEATVVMEHINGNTVLDHILMLEEHNEGIDNTACRLSEYLSLFYDATGTPDSRIILKDVNLRNFILSDKIYGIDFEDYGPGMPEEDIGKLLGYFITYRPQFSKWKCDMVQILFEILCSNLSLESKQVKNEFKKELDAIKARRSLSIPDYIYKMANDL